MEINKGNLFSDKDSNKNSSKNLGVNSGKNLEEKLQKKQISIKDFVESGHLKDDNSTIELYLSLITEYMKTDYHDWSQRPEEEQEIIKFFDHIKECPECQQKIEKYNLKEKFEDLWK